jgi:hypothetical protein
MATATEKSIRNAKISVCSICVYSLLFIVKHFAICLTLFAI